MNRGRLSLFEAAGGEPEGLRYGCDLLLPDEEAALLAGAGKA